jgi:hypothetical protein
LRARSQTRLQAVIPNIGCTAEGAKLSLSCDFLSGE